MYVSPESSLTTCMFSKLPAAIAACVYSAPSQVSETLAELLVRLNWNRLTPELLTVTVLLAEGSFPTLRGAARDSLWTGILLFSMRRPRSSSWSRSVAPSRVTVPSNVHLNPMEKLLPNRETTCHAVT